jgi:hypothetical protein
VVNCTPEQKKGVVLLFDTDHHWMNPIMTEVATGATALLVGDQPQPAPVPFVGMILWVLRGLLLIPALQIVGVAATHGSFWSAAPLRWAGPQGTEKGSSPQPSVGQLGTKRRVIRAYDLRSR